VRFAKKAPDIMLRRGEHGPIVSASLVLTFEWGGASMAKASGSELKCNRSHAEKQ
jgi:hypothetical protein